MKPSTSLKLVASNGASLETPPTVVSIHMTERQAEVLQRILGIMTAHDLKDRFDMIGRDDLSPEELTMTLLTTFVSLVDVIGNRL